MAFTGTSLLSLPIITTGTESGAWGNITNNGLTQYLDTSIAGALSITSSITLANTSGDATGTNLTSTTAQYRTLVVPASGPSANIVITAPSSNRTYHVVNRNATYTVQIRAGANSGVTLGVNQSATVTYNSTSADYELVGVVGASTATDNAVARFDGTTGEIIQNSGATIDDSANLSTTGTATATKFIPTGNVTAGNGMYLPAANTLAWSNNGSETMRIDSSGNVGIGTSSPVAKLDIISDTARMYFSNQSTTAFFTAVNTSNSAYAPMAINGSELLLATGNTERARIDSSGNLLVGTTSNYANRLRIVGPGNSGRVAAILGSTAGDTGNAGLLISKYDNDSTTSQVYVQFSMNNDGTASGQINANGANQAAFGSWSDSRLKENIVNLPSQLANIMALRPVEFDYIESEGGGHQTGFVAQEMQEVYPDAVGKRAPDGMLTITGWSKTEARLVKAIQEQQAIIEQLKARLDAANL